MLISGAKTSFYHFLGRNLKPVSLEGGFMEKRSFERIDANFDVRFSYGYIFYTGNIKNLSERGLFIRTKNCLPINSLILIMFRSEGELLKILARVKRSSKSNKFDDGMGIEVLNPQRKYIDYVNSMKSIYSS